MTQRNHSAKEFLIGAAVGSLLGGVAALLTAPKSGEKLRGDIHDMYEGLTDRTEDLVDQVSRKGKSIVNCVNKKGDWSSKAKALMCELSTLKNHEEECGTREMLIGTAIGGVVGAVAGLMLAPKSGAELRQDLVDTYEDVAERAEDFTSDVQKKGKAFGKKARKQTNKWLDLARNVAGEYMEDAEEVGEEFVDGAKDKIDNVIEWATLGYKVWQGLNKRR
jgi:gas vesicle protein